MFIGRERELAQLRKRYDSDSFEFVGVYGRRRVGKTSLLSEFVRGLRCGWCAAVEDDASMNLRLLSQAVWSLGHPESDPESAPVYADFRAALMAAFDAAEEERGVLVIDEFPYLARADTSFPSVLQAVIDQRRAGSRLMLVLCGSSLSFMKEQLLDRKSPLYGRRTAQIELKPFDFFDARRFFPSMPARSALEVYGMVGGVPLYLLQFSEGKETSQNLTDVFLDPSSILYEEPESLLRQEVSKAAPYNAVISSIAGGASQHNEIATRSGLSTNALDYYLKELVRLGLVEREEPVVAKGGRRAAWRLTDNLFRFWYRFIRPHRALVERGLGEMVAKRVEEGLPEYLGPVFEEVCRDWLWRRLAQGVLPFEMTAVGRWWGNDPAARSQAEIDLVALEGARTVMVGECKWRNEAMGADQLAKLDRRAHLAGAGGDAARWAFSRSGFTGGCSELAQSLGARLVDFEEMCAEA